MFVITGVNVELDLRMLSIHTLSLSSIISTIEYPQGISSLLVGTRMLLTFICNFAPSRGLFSLALYAWFFVMLSSSSFGKNTILLNLAIKTFQCSLERFVIADFNFRHQGFPPLVACFQSIQIASKRYTSWTCGKIISQPRASCQDFFACFVACLPNASINTTNPNSTILNKLIVRSSSIAAVDTFKAFGAP